LAVSRLVLHYIADADALFAKVYQALVPGGRFVFSVEHPVITSTDWGWQGNGQREDWVVDNYFNSGAHTILWMGGEVIRYHRTIEEYFMGLQKAGFVVDALRESTPQREHFIDEASFQRRQRVPLFLILAARK
jgi:SAM-dependent methyltransferase